MNRTDSAIIAQHQATAKIIYCVVKVIRLPLGWRTFQKHYDNHCRQYGLRAKTLPNGRESLLVITK